MDSILTGYITIETSLITSERLYMSSLITQEKGELEVVDKDVMDEYKMSGC